MYDALQMPNLLMYYSSELCLQERVQKLKTTMAKVDDDKKQLRLGLDDAENRVTKGELNRRSLEGELQRMRLSLTDKETENQVGGGKERDTEITCLACQNHQRNRF